MSCSGLNIFGDDTCEGGGGGLTPGQEQDLNDVVEKTQLQSFVSPNTTDFIGNLIVNGLPVGGGGNPFIDPVIKTSVTIENDIAANTLVLTSSQTTGFNLIESISGPLDINSTDLTINLNATLTENIGSNKLSTISGNMTELISANKVLNVGGNNLSNASLHQITGPIVNNASLTTPILNGIDEINSGGDININNIGGQLIIANDTVVVNSFEGIDMTGTNGGIQVGGGRITTTNVAFTNDEEMVTKKYIDDNDSGFTQAFSATILIDDAYIFPQQNLDFNGSSTFSLFNFYSIPVSCKLISLSFLSNTTFSRTVRVIKNFQSPIIASVVVSGNAGVFPFATPIEFIGGEIVAFRIDRNNSEPIDENIITAYFEKTDNASPTPNIIVNDTLSSPPTSNRLTILQNNNTLSNSRISILENRLYELTNSCS